VDQIGKGGGRIDETKKTGNNGKRFIGNVKQKIKFLVPFCGFTIEPCGKKRQILFNFVLFENCVQPVSGG
jgi:hypothetical protein